MLLHKEVPSDRDIWAIKQQYPQQTFLTFTREGAAHVNVIVVKHLFDKQTPIAGLPCDNDLQYFPVYKDMHVFITQNRDKDAGVVNGQSATVVNAERNTILLRLPNGKLVFTYPLTMEKENGTLNTVFLFTPAHATTVCKSLGANLDQVIIWIDSTFAPEGTTYVALSRVRCGTDMKILTPLQIQQFRPVQSFLLF